MSRVKAEVTKRWSRGPRTGTVVQEVKEFESLQVAQKWFRETRGRPRDNFVVTNMTIIQGETLA